jgi:hypothetical protein
MDPKWKTVVVTTARCLGSISKSLLDAVKEDDHAVERDKMSGHSEGAKAPAPNAADASNTPSRVA